MRLVGNFFKRKAIFYQKMKRIQQLKFFLFLLNIKIEYDIIESLKSV